MDKPSERSPFLEVAWLGMVLACYVVAPREWFPNGLAVPEEWSIVLVPSFLLLGAMLWTLPVLPPRRIRLQGPPSIVGAIGVTAAAVLVSLWAWLMPSAQQVHVNVPTVVGLVLLVPLAEELYFRGFLLDHLLRNLGAPAAFVLSTLLFAGLHAPPGHFVSMLVLGAAAGGVALATRSAGWAVLVHMTWNACAVVEAGDAGTRKLVLCVAAIGLLALSAWGRAARKEDAQPATETSRAPAGLL